MRCFIRSCSLRKDGEHLGLNVLGDNAARFVEARQDQRDDLRRHPAVDESADLDGTVDEVRVVLPVPVLQAPRDDQALLLVVAQQPGGVFDSFSSEPNLAAPNTTTTETTPKLGGARILISILARRNR